MSHLSSPLHCSLQPTLNVSPNPTFHSDKNPTPPRSLFHHLIYQRLPTMKYQSHQIQVWVNKGIKLPINLLPSSKGLFHRVCINLFLTLRIKYPLTTRCKTLTKSETWTVFQPTINRMATTET
uniref:Uncharacterized protein n=1 Tax=Cacopsylla melanoneura TaxID=428564 RepID=A0A8D8RDR0_9HEMI